MHDAFLERVLSQATAWLLTYGIHSSVLLGGTWLVLRTKLVRSLSTQDALWKAALLGALVTATLHSVLDLPRWNGAESAFEGAASVEVARALPARAAAQHPEPLAVRDRADALAELAHPVLLTDEAGFGARTGASGSAPARPGLPWALVALLGWLATASLAVTRLFATRLRLRRHLGARRAVTEPELSALLERLRREAGVRRPVRLSVSPLLSTPIAYGRSEICVPPRALTELSPRQQEAMLAHELAHLVRRDPTWRTATSLVQSVFFFQPLNAVAARRIHALAELLCDDWAVGRTGRRLVLAQCLAKVAGWLEEDRAPLPAPGMAQPGSNLVQRVRRLAAPTGDVPLAHPRRTALAASALLLAVSCGMPTVSSSETQGFVARCLSFLRGTPEEVADEGDGELGLQLVAASTTRFSDLLASAALSDERQGRKGCEHCDHCRRIAQRERSARARERADDELERLSRELDALARRLERQAEQLERGRSRPDEQRARARDRVEEALEAYRRALPAVPERLRELPPMPEMPPMPPMPPMPEMPEMPAMPPMPELPPMPEFPHGLPGAPWQQSGEAWEAYENQLEQWETQWETRWEPRWQAWADAHTREYEDLGPEWAEPFGDEWIEEYGEVLDDWGEAFEEPWTDQAEELEEELQEWAEELEESMEDADFDPEAWEEWTDARDADAARWAEWFQLHQQWAEDPEAWSRDHARDRAGYDEALREYRRALRGRNCDHDCKRRCRNGCTHPDDEREDDSRDRRERETDDAFVRNWPDPRPSSVYSAPLER